jgi:hypothetical protein
MKKKNLKKQKRKEEIITLAEDAKLKINQNRILSEQIDNYNKHIQMIKSFMNKYTQNTKITESISKDNNKNKFIKNEFINYYKELKKSIGDLRESTNKVKQKYDTNNDIYFDDISEQNLSYKQMLLDSFILSYSLEQKLNIIKKLKESVHSSRDYNIFREPKRETIINTKYGEEFIDDINQDYQSHILYEIKQFNKYHNRCLKKMKKINNCKNKIQILNQIISYFQQIIFGKSNYIAYSNNYNSNYKLKSVPHQVKNNIYNYKSNKIVKSDKITNKKIYKEEDNDNLFYNTINLNKYGDLNNDNFGYTLGDLNSYETDQTFNFGNINNNLLSLTNNTNKGEYTEPKKNKKINLPTVEELFDLTNNEGEKEAIIDEELHSDEEIVFETKIKSKKKIIVDYLPKIKKEVPNLYLSQIEFNKSKVMNEADLYSVQRRQFQMQNLDENIKMMKKKLKIIKRRCKINEEKCETIRNYTKECEENYKSLKNLKIQMSMQQEKVSFMKKEFFTQHTKDVIDEEDELNYQKEMDDYLNDPELNDPYFEQYQNLQTDITHRQIDNDNMLIIKKINNDNIEKNEHDNIKYDYTRTHRERKKEKIKRANSK